MTTLSNAYLDHIDAATAPEVSRVERSLMCDLLETVGPSAPTLCEGWDAHHLVAHVRGREGSPLRQVASVLPGLGDRSVDHIVARHDFSSLVEQVRAGPPPWSVFGLPRLEPLLNVVEFLVHHEDIRRAGEGCAARDLPRWAEDQIWTRVVGLARLSQRRAPTGVLLERTDTGQQVRVAKGDRDVVVCGLPSEMALYLTGRPAVAAVDVLGDPGAVAAFTGPAPS